MTWDVREIEKSYEGKTVITGFSYSFRSDGVYCLMAPSGAGKTTLLGILAGIVRPDAGQLGKFASCRVSMVFQDDRLFEGLSAVRNLRAAVPGLSADGAGRLLAEILPRDSLDQPVRELSGGMRRRVAVARAAARKSEVLLLDEPFAGLDEGLHERTAGFLLRHREGRMMIAATHDRKDAALLGGEILQLCGPESG